MIAPPPEGSRRSRWVRTGLAWLVVMLIAFGAYLLLMTEGVTVSGTISITFLLVVPAVSCAVISFITDPDGDRGLGHYLALPFQSLGVVIIAGALIMREGVVCIVLLSPLWLAGGLVGSMAVYYLKKRLRERGQIFASALLLIPILSVQIEERVPVTVRWETVSNDVLIDAPPERVWPLLLSIRDIGPDEGRWNFTQDVLGIPRPSEARLHVRVSSAIRSARWGADIRFEEHILRVEPGRSLAWAFAFPDGSVRRHTDRHVAPDGPQLRIAYGAYELTPTADGGTRLRLETRYALRTRLNGYAAWWGGRFLGDIQDNILAIVKERAEVPLAD